MRCATCGDRAFQPSGGSPLILSEKWLHNNQFAYLKRGYKIHDAVPVDDAEVPIEKVAKWVP